MSKALNTLTKEHNLVINYVDDQNQDQQFAQADIERLLELESNLKNRMLDIAKSLHEIHEKKYFYMRGYAKLKDYVKEQLTIGIAQAYNYIEIEQKFGGLIDYTKYPMSRLLEIAKQPDKIDKLKTAKNKDAKIKEYIQELKNAPEKEKPSPIDIPLKKKTMDMFLQDVIAFRKEIQLGSSFDLEDEDNLYFLGQTLETFEEIKRDLDPIILDHIMEVTERKKREGNIPETQVQIMMKNKVKKKSKKSDEDIIDAEIIPDSDSDETVDSETVESQTEEDDRPQLEDSHTHSYEETYDDGRE